MGKFPIARNCWLGRKSGAGMFAFFFHANGQQESLQTASPPPLTLWSRKPLPGPVMVGTQSADSTELRTHDDLSHRRVKKLTTGPGKPATLRVTRHQMYVPR